MSVAIRVMLILVSFLTLIFVISRVRKSKIRIEDSIFWVCLSILLIVFSVFPQIFYFFSGLLGFESPINLVFLFFIFILLIQSFNLTIQISQADTKIKELTQQLAIEKFEHHQNDKTLTNNSLQQAHEK